MKVSLPWVSVSGLFSTPRLYNKLLKVPPLATAVFETMSYRKIPVLVDQPAAQDLPVAAGDDEKPARAKATRSPRVKSLRGGFKWLGSLFRFVQAGANRDGAVRIHGAVD